MGLTYKVVVVGEGNLAHIKFLVIFGSAVPDSITFPDGLKGEFLKKSDNGFLYYKEIENGK